MPTDLVLLPCNTSVTSIQVSNPVNPMATMNEGTAGVAEASLTHASSIALDAYTQPLRDNATNIAEIYSYCHAEYQQAVKENTSTIQVQTSTQQYVVESLKSLTRQLIEAVEAVQLVMSAQEGQISLNQHEVSMAALQLHSQHGHVGRHALILAGAAKHRPYAKIGPALVTKRSSAQSTAFMSGTPCGNLAPLDTRSYDNLGLSYKNYIASTAPPPTEVAPSRKATISAAGNRPLSTSGSIRVRPASDYLPRVPSRSGTMRGNSALAMAAFIQEKQESQIALSDQVLVSNTSLEKESNKVVEEVPTTTSSMQQAIAVAAAKRASKIGSRPQSFIGSELQNSSLTPSIASVASAASASAAIVAFTSDSVQEQVKSVPSATNITPPTLPFNSIPAPPVAAAPPPPPPPSNDAPLPLAQVPIPSSSVLPSQKTSIIPPPAPQGPSSMPSISAIPPPAPAATTLSKSSAKSSIVNVPSPAPATTIPGPPSNTSGASIAAIPSPPKPSSAPPPPPLQSMPAPPPPVTVPTATLPPPPPKSEVSAPTLAPLPPPPKEISNQFPNVAPPIPAKKDNLGSPSMGRRAETQSPSLSRKHISTPPPPPSALPPPLNATSTPLPSALPPPLNATPPPIAGKANLPPPPVLSNTPPPPPSVTKSSTPAPVTAAKFPPPPLNQFPPPPSVTAPSKQDSSSRLSMIPNNLPPPPSLPITNLPPPPIAKNDSTNKATDQKSATVSVPKAQDQSANLPPPLSSATSKPVTSLPPPIPSNLPPPEINLAGKLPPPSSSLPGKVPSNNLPPPPPTSVPHNLPTPPTSLPNNLPPPPSSLPNNLPPPPRPSTPNNNLAPPPVSVASLPPPANLPPPPVSSLPPPPAPTSSTTVGKSATLNGFPAPPPSVTLSKGSKLPTTLKNELPPPPLVAPGSLPAPNNFPPPPPPNASPNKRTSVMNVFPK